MDIKTYKLTVDPRILELLGPNLYTNIYYVLAELIANAYDADASNVYIIANDDNITVEDDGNGMSYENGDIAKFLNVAGISRTNDEDAVSKTLKRHKMGRKGVGKLAALSVSEEVEVLTINNGEKSGFVMSRHPKGEMLDAIPEDKIQLSMVEGNGTAIVMKRPQYRLHKTLSVVKKNLIKIFPLVSEDFAIHIIRDGKEEIIDRIDDSYASQLCSIITLGDDFAYLADLVPNQFPNIRDSVVSVRPEYSEPITMTNNNGEEKEYHLKITGWIGTYETTKGRKTDILDFPDNFISLYANKKMGEFNVLPRVGQNKMNESYVVGQLHIDLFELSELPDMALSNRQGYKTDDDRYIVVEKYVRETLLSDILSMRTKFTDEKNKDKKKKAQKNLENEESKFKEAVISFKSTTTTKAAEEINKLAPDVSVEDIEKIVNAAIESNIPSLGIKPTVDSHKKKILISHTGLDSPLAEIIFKMLVYNNVPIEDIIYTSSEEEECRIPEGTAIYDYLKKFFVDSYSDKKMYVVFVTSENTKNAWGAMVEIGASWITQIDNKIFNIPPFRPEHPLNDEHMWHTTNRNKDTQFMSMTKLNADVFCVKIEDICDRLGYEKKTRAENKTMLASLIAIE